MNCHSSLKTTWNAGDAVLKFVKNHIMTETNDKITTSVHPILSGR